MSAKANRPAQIAFEFIKANSFRVVHADGAFGGLSPGGDAIVTSFYSERAPVPTRVVHELSAEGRIGEEVQRVSRDAVVRELEVAVVMDLQTAKVVSRWLDEKVKALEEALVDKGKGAAAKRPTRARTRKRKE